MIRKFGDENENKNWEQFMKDNSDKFPHRTLNQVRERYSKLIKASSSKGPWTEEEDAKVVNLVKEYGAKKWSEIAKHLPGRVGKQCRERWHNHLNPDINKEAWTYEEDRIILECHMRVGNRWAEMSKHMRGRYACSVSSYCLLLRRRSHSQLTFSSTPQNR